MAASFGLVPRQVTTHGRPKLVGISKRGSKYLRKMLIQGARAAMPNVRKYDLRIALLLRGQVARTRANTADVALAAKMARIVWALLRHERVYEVAAIPVGTELGWRDFACLPISTYGERKMA